MTFMLAKGHDSGRGKSSKEKGNKAAYLEIPNLKTQRTSFTLVLRQMDPKGRSKLHIPENIVKSDFSVLIVSQPCCSL